MTARPRTRRDILAAAADIDVSDDATTHAIAEALFRASEPYGPSVRTIERAFAAEPDLLIEVRQMTHSRASNAAPVPSHYREAAGQDDDVLGQGPPHNDARTSLSICYLHSSWWKWRLRHESQCAGCREALYQGEEQWLTHYEPGTHPPLHCGRCVTALPAFARSLGTPCAHPKGMCPSDPNSPTFFGASKARTR